MWCLSGEKMKSSTPITFCVCVCAFVVGGGGVRGKAGVEIKENIFIKKKPWEYFTFCNGNTPLELVEGDA